MQLEFYMRTDLNDFSMKTAEVCTAVCKYVNNLCVKIGTTGLLDCWLHSLISVCWWKVAWPMLRTLLVELFRVKLLKRRPFGKLHKWFVNFSLLILMKLKII